MYERTHDFWELGRRPVLRFSVLRKRDHKNKATRGAINNNPSLDCLTLPYFTSSELHFNYVNLNTFPSSLTCAPPSPLNSFLSACTPCQCCLLPLPSVDLSTPRSYLSSPQQLSFLHLLAPPAPFHDPTHPSTQFIATKPYFCNSSAQQPLILHSRAPTPSILAPTHPSAIFIHPHASQFLFCFLPARLLCIHLSHPPFILQSVS